MLFLCQIFFCDEEYLSKNIFELRFLVIGYKLFTKFVYKIAIVKHYT